MKNQAKLLKIIFKEKGNMNETFKFLKENTQVNYLATVKGDKPSCRPFGDPG